MERSGAVTNVLARIMKMMDRSNESLLRSINHFEGVHTRAIASPRVPQPRADLRGLEALSNPVRRRPRI